MGYIAAARGLIYTSPNKSPLESYVNEVISRAMPALDGVGLRSLDYETPMAASMTEM